MPDHAGGFKAERLAGCFNWQQGCCLPWVYDASGAPVYLAVTMFCILSLM